MKVTIRGVPEFVFYVDMMTALALVAMLHRHYDASVRRLVEDQTGALARWVNRFRWSVESEFEPDGTLAMRPLSFSEVNLLAKGLEMASPWHANEHIDREQYAKFRVLSVACARAMETANQIYLSGDWKKEMEL